MVIAALLFLVVQSLLNRDRNRDFVVFRRGLLIFIAFALWCAQGNVRAIEENGLMLAAFDFAKYSNVTHQLEQGDRLLLYTDGIVEAADASGKFFGQDSLSDLLRQTSKLTPSEAADRIIDSVGRWAVSQDDDLTVLVCDYLGTQQ